MKVGTDALLLGAFTASFPDLNINNYLEIGSGTGIVSLMVAQKKECNIQAIDLNEHAFVCAKGNFLKSSWTNRLSASNTSYQEYYFNNTKKFDLIFSNPPFFEIHKSIQNKERELARNIDLFDINEFLLTSKQHLSAEGSIIVILPYLAGLHLIKTGLQNLLYCNRVFRIFSIDGKPYPERIICCFSPVQKEVEIASLAILNTDLKPTNEYRLFLKDYLLD